jgi:hypothetical protein
MCQKARYSNAKSIFPQSTAFPLLPETLRNFKTDALTILEK